MYLQIFRTYRLASAILSLLRFFIGGLLYAFIFFSANTSEVQAQIAVNKNFSPINVVSGETSTLTVDLFNPGAVAATSAAFTDTLPAGLVIASPPSATNTCGGTVTATAGAGSFGLTAGTIPAASGATPGSCKITVSVLSSTSSSYVNTIPAGGVTSSRGSNGSPASATLTVATPAPLTGSKVFSPVNLHGDNISTLTITVSNSNNLVLTNAALTDTLPTGLVVASPTNASTTCGAGSISATAGLRPVSLSGGTIPASGSCTITVDVKSSVGSTVFANSTLTNTIAASNITNTQNVTNSAAISRTITVQSGAQVVKSFAPASISAGGTSTLSFVLSNYNNTAITSANFLDAMPAGVTVTGITLNTCGGTPSFTATQLQLSNGTVPAAPVAAGSGTCTISASVTAAAAGSYLNSVPAGLLNGINYPAASATLTVTPPSSISVTKAFSPTSIPQTGTSTLTITLNNSAAVAANITSFLDDLTTMGTGISVATLPAATTTCGGTVTAVAGSTSISKADGAIPAAGNCRIVVPIVLAATAAATTRTNTIPVDGLKTSLGNNTVAATANLTVQTGATLAKAFATNPVPAGGVSRLTITISHRTGAVAFTGMGITDTLPAGHTIATPPNTVTTCGGVVSAPAGGSTIGLTGGSLAAGATSCTISVDVRVPAGAGSATNTIAIGAFVTDQGVTNATTATATLTRINTWVTLNKAFSPTSISPGGTSRLSVVIANNNGSAIALTGVGLTDVFPSGMTVQSSPNATFTGTGCTGASITATAGAGQISFAGASISVGSICTLAVDVTTSFTGTLTNTIPVSAVSSTQAVTNINSPSASLTLLGTADVRVTKTDGVTSVQAGGTTAYTIVVTNNGPNDVAGVKVADNAPTGMTFTSWACTPSSGSACTDVSGVGNILTTVTLKNSGTATFTVNAAISSGASGSATNTVNITEPDTINDPDRTNNVANDIDTILPSPDLTIAKSHTGNFLQGQIGAIYLLRVSNIGTAASSGTVTVTDTLPSDLTPTAATGTGWSCVIASQTVTCTRADAVAASSNFPDISISSNVSATAPASLTNTADVSGGNEPSGHLSNNSASDPTTIDPPVPNLTLDKFVTPTGIQPPGTDLTYKIILSNIGTGAAQLLIISDPIPPNTDFKIGSEFINPATTGVTFIVEFSNDGGTTWTYTPVSAGGGASSGYDRNVTNIRWRASVGNLSPTAPNNVADIGFTSKIQ